MNVRSSSAVFVWLWIANDLLAQLDDNAKIEVLPVYGHFSVAIFYKLLLLLSSSSSSSSSWAVTVVAVVATMIRDIYNYMPGSNDVSGLFCGYNRLYGTCNVASHDNNWCTLTLQLLEVGPQCRPRTAVFCSSLMFVLSSLRVCGSHNSWLILRRPVFTLLLLAPLSFSYSIVSIARSFHFPTFFWLLSSWHFSIP